MKAIVCTKYGPPNVLELRKDTGDCSLYQTNLS